MNIAVAISSFSSGLLGAMGFGGGTVLIIYLTGFLSLEQKQAQGINLVFFLLTGVFGLAGNIRKGLVDKSSFITLIKFALPGMIVGFILLPVIPSFWLKRLFGTALILLGIKTFFEKDKKQKSNGTG